MKLLFTLILLVTVTTISAQTDLTEAQINTTITNNNAISGDIYHDTDNELYYMGVNSGGLRLMSDFKSVKISNELYFEDSNYMYVSMQKEASDFIVIRYSLSDINLEEKATGNGTQPVSLINVQGLTYN